MKAYIEAQGSLLRLKLLDSNSRPPTNRAARRSITSFSAASRRRLLRFMARLKTRKIRATFITLTFTEIVENVYAKKVLKRFISRVRRRYPQCSAVWRMEYQERGAIHFHILAFNLPFWKQSELQRTWEDCTEEITSIVDIRLVHGSRSVMAYISKYIAKKSQTEVPTSLDDVSYQHDQGEGSAGRFWGYINKELLPLGQKLTGVLIRSDVIKNLSKLAWWLIGSDNPYNSVSFHLFTDRALHRLEVAVEEGGLYGDEWHWSQQFTEREHSDFAYQHSHFSQTDYDNDYAKDKPQTSRPRSARSVQPCTSGWTSRSSFVSRAEV